VTNHAHNRRTEVKDVTIAIWRSDAIDCNLNRGAMATPRNKKETIPGNALTIGSCISLSDKKLGI
jgi:hypothetical protein